MDLLSPRSNPRFGKLEGIVLALYVAFLAAVIPYHEPWVDEAQAWLIAKDSSLSDIFLRRLHYEGAPGLWHFILWVASHLGLPYSGLDWLGGIFAIAGIYVLLRYSPFPAILRCLLPFTFFLAYQYAIIARGYVLFPLLVFTLCALFKPKKPRPIWFAVVAGLLINISLHGAAVACAFFLLYLYQQREMLRSGRDPRLQRQLFAAIGVVVVASIFSVATALPAPDIGFGFQKKASQPIVHRVLEHLLPETPGTLGTPLPLPEIHLPHNPADKGSLDLWLWKEVYQPRGTGMHKLVGMAVTKLYMIGCLVSYPISTSTLLAFVFFALALYWLFSRSGLRYLLPYLALMIACILVWVLEHHTGLLFITLLATFWLAYQSPPSERATPAWLDQSFLWAFVLISVLQVTWSIYSISFDRKAAYDPGAATASFLKQYAAGKTIDTVSQEDFSLVPYFPQQIFSNYKTRYYIWSSHTDITTHIPEALAAKPDIIIATTVQAEDQYMNDQIRPLIAPGTFLSPDLDPYLTAHGYRKTNVFCGDRPMRSGIVNRVCNNIYQSPQSLSF